MAVQQTTTETILPQWYTEYAQKLTGRALAASEEPYQAYSLPRIASFAPEQEQAFAMAPTAAAAYKPYLGAAGELATAGATGSSYGLAQPYLGAAGEFATTGGMGSSLGVASPYITRGAGSFTDPGVAGRYMSPYIQNVVSGIGDIAARNLREKILPEVNRTFIGGGTFGGSRSAEFNQRAIRDAQAAALSQQVEAMRQGYKEAADLYGTEASRALTAGQQIGALAGQDYTRLLDASRNLASIGQTAGQLGGTDYQRMLDAAQRMGILGESAQAAGLKEAGTLEAIGAQRQALGQKSADLAYQDFLEQREYPFTQLQKLTGIAGTPSASGSSTVQTAPAPSKTGQILGGLTGAVGLLGAAGVFKDGGPVEKKVPPMKSGLGWLKDKN